MKTQRLVLAVAALAGLSTAHTPAFTQTWTQTSAPITNWHAVALSADGTSLVAVARGTGPIVISTNGGVAWMPTSAPVQNWYAVASSADGSKLIATASSGGSTYISADSGATWIPANVEGYLSFYFNYWSSVASSADGAKLLVGFYDSVHRSGGMAGSTDSGATWTSLTNAPATVSTASSADGAKLVAGSGFCCGPDSAAAGTFATSTNSGATWTGTGVDSGSWNAVASSADGSRLVAAVYGGAIYVSADSGATWTATGAPVADWISIASSADGTRLVAAQGAGLFIPGPGVGGPVYTSTDAGLTWTSNNVPNAFAVAISADGSKLVAAVNGGGIWTLQSAPTAVLNIARSRGNFLLSWIVPSIHFVLQENADLSSTNWADVTIAPKLNLTNLQNELIVPAPTGNRFYRLKH